MSSSSATATAEAASSTLDTSSSCSSDSEINMSSRFEVTPISIHVQARGRGASISEQGRMRRKYKRSMSANAGMMPALPEHTLRTILTMEQVPHMDHYRQSIDHQRRKMRPTIEELMDRRVSNGQTQGSSANHDPESAGNSGKVAPFKLGWFKGVYVKCLLNIWGVMLFLRLSWLVGQAGILEGLSIITLANLVTLITAISMSAVSTNGKIRGGGIYYMLSRSLGPEFGGAIGLMITLANAIAVSMYVIGFCESLLDMLTQYTSGFNGIVGDSQFRTNDIRLIGSIVMVAILGLAIIGMDWVSKVEVALLGLLLVAQVDFIIGSVLPPTDKQMADGFVGFSSQVFVDNLWSDYQVENEEQYSFFKVFAVFFPAVTGIVAGANFSGDLKDPESAIPKGTLAAIATTYVSYFSYCLIIGGCTLRQASGILDEVLLTKEILNDSFIAQNNITFPYNDCFDRQCIKGSQKDQQLLEIISAWGPLIYAGCFAATLSSAIASLVGAPRVFQAVAKDKLFPGIATFGDGHGPNNDPIKGYFLIFFISLACILIGDLNAISTLLSNFFVASYALMNFSVFHASITKTPGWRPGFKYYNKWISLAGTILCVIVMFLMSYITALITFVCIIFLYIWIKSRKPDVNWGSSTQSQHFITALKSVQYLTKVEDHVKNYRPKLMVLSGDPSHRPSLIDFANLITKELSLMTCVHVVKKSSADRVKNMDWKRKEEIKMRGEKWLQNNHIKAFHAVTFNDKISEGLQSAIDFCGLGKLSPNMLFLGFMENWHKDDEAMEDFFQTLFNAFNNHLAIGLLRLRGGIDLIKMAHQEQFLPSSPEIMRDFSAKTSSCQSTESMDSGVDLKLEDIQISPDPLQIQSNNEVKIDPKKLVWPGKKSFLKSGNKRRPSNHTVISDEIFEKSRVFRSKKKLEGTIDVYWLYDDGGLTLLLPYILSTRTKYSRSKLRIFFLSHKVENIDEETRNMVELMAKFRIQCEDIVAISDAMGLPAKHTREAFLRMIEEEIGKDKITEEMLKSHAKKINFNLRIAEIVRQTSCSSNLVVMTLPVPKKDHLPQTLYMAILEYTTRDMPPFLYVRGNQESVLTFYS